MRFDQQLQSATVAEFEGFVCGSELADSGISERHSEGLYSFNEP